MWASWMCSSTLAPRPRGSVTAANRGEVDKMKDSGCRDEEHKRRDKNAMGAEAEQSFL